MVAVSLTRPASRLNRGGKCPAWALCGLGLLGVGSPGLAAAAHEHGNQAFTLFLSAEAVQRNADAHSRLDRSETSAVADILLGLRHDRWRFLSEFVLAPDEHEFERLQLGYEIKDNVVLWLGRYHQPASAWNIFYHHGQYLQTSITRPWIENWEDEGGILPQHVVGALLESQHSLRGDSALRMTLGGGLAPQFQADRLNPFDQYISRDKVAGSYVGARIEWLPDVVGEDTIGIIASHAEMPVERSDTLFGAHVDHGVYGTFFSLSRGRSRALGALYIVSVHAHQLALPGSSRHSAGYLQFDYTIAGNLTAFARGESLSDATQSQYIAQFPDVLVRRAVGGLRWQLPHRNALSVEFSRNTDRVHGTYTEGRLQWSAALP